MCTCVLEICAIPDGFFGTEVLQNSIFGRGSAPGP